MQLYRGITSFVKKILSCNFISNNCNDSKAYFINFKAVGQTRAELHIFKVEKLDACIRPLFANPVTYVGIIYRHKSTIRAKKFIAIANYVFVTRTYTSKAHNNSQDRCFPNHDRLCNRWPPFVYT